MRRLTLLVSLIGLAFVVQGAAAESLLSDRCRTLSILRFKGDLFFHHKLKLRRPATGRRLGIGLERACDDTPAEDPPPWVGVPVFALDGVRATVAVAPARRQVVFYNPYLCNPRLSEGRFLLCLRRR